MSDKLIDALKEMDDQRNDGDRPFLTLVNAAKLFRVLPALLAFVEAADVCAEEGVMAGCAEPDCPDTQCTMRMKYDAARAALVSALEGEKT